MKKNKVLTEAFIWLAIGLLICFGASFVCSYSETMFNLVYASLNGYGYLVWLIAEIAIALFLTVRIRKLAPSTAKLLYLLYSLLTGISLTGIFIFYTASSLAFVFLATAVTFGVFAIIGKTTQVDMSKWWVYLGVGLLAIIVMEIINIFLMNNTLNIVLCIVSILVFCAYIAYDVQRAMDETFLSDCENKGVYIAFQLFLDIINVFLDLLRLFGKARDN